MRLPKWVISTWGGLHELGFVEDAQDALAELIPMLHCRLGKLKLRASLTAGRYSARVVVLHAEYVSARSCGRVDDEYPLGIESLEQLAAFVVFTAKKVMGPSEPVGPLPPWFLQGWRDSHLLPWEQDLAAYEARPHCTARREWVKLALKTLAEHLAQAPGDTPVRFAFDGSVLTIRCRDDLGAIPARGKAWPNAYTIHAERLRRLPKRLMRDTVWFGVWESKLEINTWTYSGVVAERGQEKATEIAALIGNDES